MSDEVIEAGDFVITGPDHSMARKLQKHSGMWKDGQEEVNQPDIAHSCMSSVVLLKFLCYFSLHDCMYNFTKFYISFSPCRELAIRALCARLGRVESLLTAALSRSSGTRKRSSSSQKAQR